MMKTTLVGIIKVHTHVCPFAGEAQSSRRRQGRLSFGYEKSEVNDGEHSRNIQLSFRLIQNNSWKMESERSLYVKLLELCTKG